MAIAQRCLAAVIGLIAGTDLVAAQDVATGPRLWETQFQPPVTAVFRYAVWFGNYTLVIMMAIVLFVTLLLAWVIYRYNEKRNPVPSRLSHNTLVEVLWTVLPVLILVAIAIPSFRLLYGQYDPAKIYAGYDATKTPFLTVKVTGSQWYWDVEYAADDASVANGVGKPVTFTVTLIPQDQLKSGQLRNLSVDNPMVVPVNTFVKVQVTATDVIHSFAMPPFGVKMDGVPGRLNETYFNAEKEGIYYGQCSELCGKDHAFMPIAIRVVSQDQFRTWVAAAATDLPGAYQTLAGLLEADKTKTVASR